MARVNKDRTLETSISTGTGDFTLAGAVEGYQTFYEVGVLEAGDTFSYVIETDPLSSDWETGTGTLLTSTTFSRSVRYSSNNNSLVDFAAGDKTVFLSPNTDDLQPLITFQTDQTAHTVYAGPATGTDTPTFRALVASDIPDLSATYATPSYVTTALSPYATTVSVTSAINTALIPYSTSAQINTLLGDYLTITSAAATYATPASVTTQINSALTSYVTLTGIQTLTNKTLTTPTIGSFTNATHTHQNAAGGGQLNASNVFNAGVVSPVYGGMGADTSSLTGIYKFTVGVPSVAVAGTDYTTPTGSENLSNKTITSSSLNSTPIGASSPSTIAGTTGTFSGNLTVDTNVLLVDTTNDRVGIGRTPASKFEVQDTSSSLLKFNSGESSGTPTISVGNPTVSASKFAALSAGSSGAAFLYDSTGFFAIGPDTRANWVANNLFASIPTTFYIKSDGKIGIGTSSPSTRLHAVESDTATGVTNVLTLGHNTSALVAANFGTGILLTGESSTQDNREMARVKSTWTTATDASRVSNLILSTYNVGTEVDVMTLTSAGRVGINTQTPLVPLQINSTETLPGEKGGIIIARNSDTAHRLIMGYEGIAAEGNYAYIQSIWSLVAPMPLLLNPSGGYVGMGLKVPTSMLHVVDTDTATSTIVNTLTLTHNSYNTPVPGFGGGILFQGESSTTPDRSMARIRVPWVTATDASRVAKATISVWNVSTETDVADFTTTGIQSALDIKTTVSTKGPVLIDRGDGLPKRIVITNGVLSTEAV